MIQSVKSIPLIIAQLYRSDGSFSVSEVVHCEAFKRAFNIRESLFFVLQNYHVAIAVPNYLMILFNFESAYFHVSFNIPNYHGTSLKLVDNNSNLNFTRSAINKPDFGVLFSLGNFKTTTSDVLRI